jgi:hypothetical protein
MNTDDYFLIECSEDYVGLWSIIRGIQRDNPGINSLETRRKTLAIIKKFMQEGLIRPGMFNFNSQIKYVDNFEFWQLSPEETIIRIEKEWDALEEEPNIGDIVWFTTTEKGDKEVKKRYYS